MGVLSLFVTDSSLLVYRNATKLYILTFSPVTLLNLYIVLIAFWWNYYDFLYIKSHHLQTEMISHLPFQFGCVLFPFLTLLLWPGLEVVKVDALILFLILAESFQTFAVENAANCRFVIYGLNCVEVYSFNTQLIESFYHEMMLNCITCFFGIC